MDVVSLFWNPIWPPRRHVNLLHSALFVSAKTGNKDKGVPWVSEHAWDQASQLRERKGSPSLPRSVA